MAALELAGPAGSQSGLRESAGVSAKFVSRRLAKTYWFVASSVAHSHSGSLIPRGAGLPFISTLRVEAPGTRLFASP
ncbi:hypothetical protein FRX31_027116 [Thalictrum thalictroides]|uniref:Uncharacterized protein n=1 Tax=Thalictrum thalictroides TaxID=46969 RepID=A0A7J6VDY1_THATH|nr:hypothetical protein FRX31_027116 [Thalictrum thalictroides]